MSPPSPRTARFDLAASKLKLDSLWVNVLKPGGTHSGHIHPHSVGVGHDLCRGARRDRARCKLEDPRLPMMMAAPPAADAPRLRLRLCRAEPGSVFLWESWLRHEVAPNAAKGDRISISFNYR